MRFSVYSFLIFLFSQCISAIRVHLSTGDIEGTTITATYSPFGNQTAQVFFGIPFVSAPVGPLRFRKPRPPKSWKGVLETKAYKPACMSDPKKTYKSSDGGPISEDCLYLNVFTNEFCRHNKTCSVMIVSHGGMFLYESASAFDPHILINNFVGQNRNIVVVTANYRLGVFGFGQLNGDSKGVVDHNLGLHDSIAAIQWVRKEIGSFGGNKDRITIAGHSAGAMMAFLISSSPLSKGLFHQQIIMSPPFIEMSRKGNFKATTAVAWHLGCLKNDTGFEKLPKAVIKDVYSCLRRVSAQDLLDAQSEVLKNSTYYFSLPFVDGEFTTDYLDRIFARNSIYPINTLLGTTSAEMRDTIYITEPENARRKLDLLRKICEHIGYEVYEEPENFAEQCFEYYKNSDDAQFLSDDSEFYSRCVDVANAHVDEKTKVFVYSYTYSGAGAAFTKYMPNVPSPHHSEDLIYVFGTHRGAMAPKDYVIEQIYSGVFADFVNFGDPSPSEEQKWVVYSKENREHFMIDFDENFEMPGMRANYSQRAVDFWSSRGFRRHHKEHYSPSFDLFSIQNLVSPIIGHLTNRTQDVQKSFEQTEILLVERERFLTELKEQRKLETSHSTLVRSAVVEGKEAGSVNVVLIIFAGTLLIGILYLSVTHFCMHHRSRQGYQLLK